MSTSDEYRELQNATLSAIQALLVETEPGTGLYLHETYATLKRERDAEPNAASAPPPQRASWNDVYKVPERDRQVLALLTEEPFTIGELADRLEADLPEVGWVCSSHVRSALQRLCRKHDVDRQPEIVQNKTRYRYFKRTELEGPIADLDRTFHDEGEVS